MADIILGHPWLLEHALLINWNTSEVQQWSKNCFANYIKTVKKTTFKSVRNHPILIEMLLCAPLPLRVRTPQSNKRFLQMSSASSWQPTYHHIEGVFPLAILPSISFIIVLYLMISSSKNAHSVALSRVPHPLPAGKLYLTGCGRFGRYLWHIVCHEHQDSWSHFLLPHGRVCSDSRASSYNGINSFSVHT